MEDLRQLKKNVTDLDLQMKDVAQDTRLLLWEEVGVEREMNGVEAVKEVHHSHQKEGPRMITLPNHHHPDPNIGNQGAVVDHLKCVKEMAATGKSH